MAPSSIIVTVLASPALMVTWGQSMKAVWSSGFAAWAARAAQMLTTAANAVGLVMRRVWSPVFR